MHRSARPAATAAAIMVLSTLCSCDGRRSITKSQPAVASTGELADACAGDSLRPAVGAPAPGLWLSEQSPSRERVAAMIGPARPDDRTLVVTHPIESVEVSGAGDTIRHRRDAAAVSLELLPPLGPAALGAGDAADSTDGSHAAATYAVSPGIRLAAYESCATSSRGPRIRYLRRDAAGRIITDVMLRRASRE